MCFMRKSELKFKTYVATFEQQEKYIQRGYDLILTRKSVALTGHEFPCFTMVRFLQEKDNQVLCITTSGVKLLVDRDIVVKHSWCFKEGYIKAGQYGYIQLI